MANKKKKTESSALNRPKPARPADSAATSADAIAGVHIISSTDIEKHFGPVSGADRLVSGPDHDTKQKNGKPGSKD